MTAPHLLIALALAARSATITEVEIVTERPAASSTLVEHGKAVTADASPVDPGTLEMELAYAPLWAGDVFGAAGASASTQAWSMTATYGVAPDVDVRLTGAFAAAYAALGDSASPQRGSGLGDVVAGARWRFLNFPDRGLEVAATASAVLPVGARGSATDLAISQGFWSGRVALVATRDLGRVTTNAELAWSAPIGGDARGAAAQLQANGAVGYHVRRWLQPELELNYQGALGASTHALALTAGVVLPWGNGHRIVAAAQRSVATWNTSPTTGALLAYKRSL